MFVVAALFEQHVRARSRLVVVKHTPRFMAAIIGWFRHTTWYASEAKLDL